MSLSDILSDGLRLLRIKLPTILLFSLLVNLPIILFRTLFPTENYSKNFIAWLSFGIDQLDYVIGYFVLIGIAYLVEASIQGKILSLADIFRFSFSRLFDVFLTGLLLLVILLGLTLLLVIPAIIWGNYFSFAIIITALRNNRGKAALSYSKKLIQEHWWRVFGIHFAIVSLCIIFYLPFRIIANNVDTKFLSTFLPHIISDISIAIGQVLSVILFLNFDYVKENQKQNRMN